MVDTQPHHPSPCLLTQDFGSTRSISSRCDLKANLIGNGCGGEIESPASSTHVLRSLPLSSKGSGPVGADVIQLTPQEVAMNLRPGELSLTWAGGGPGFGRACWRGWDEDGASGNQQGWGVLIGR